MSSISSSTIVYAITGTNRGIGLGLVEQLVTRADTLIYATVRDVSKADRLQQLAKQHGNVRIVKLSAESDDGHAALRQQVEAEAGRADVVIANAVVAIFEKTGEIDVAHMRTSYEVNVIGPVRLFQAFLPLLVRSSNPRFVQLTSLAGSITLQPMIGSFPLATYGGTKAAINLFVRRAHVEHPNLTMLLIEPGSRARIHRQHRLGSDKHYETSTPQLTLTSARLRSMRALCCLLCYLRSCADRWGQLWCAPGWNGEGAHHCRGQLHSCAADSV